MREELKEYYKTHTVKQTCKEFKISSEELYSLYGEHTKEQRLEIQKLQRIEKYGSLENFYDMQSKKSKATKLERYGDANYINLNKQKQTKLEKYGNESYVNPEKISASLQSRTAEEIKISQDKERKTKLERYGNENYNNAESISKTMRSKTAEENEERHKKASDTKLERYGDPHYCNPEKMHETKYEHWGDAMGNVDKFKETMSNKSDSELHRIQDKREATQIERYGCLGFNQKDKVTATNMEKYGVPWCCMRPECINSTRGSDSKPNIQFAELLDKNNIEYEREFILDSYRYDFKVGNNLIEIDPSVTHSTSYLYRGKSKDKMYHKDKSDTAIKYGYRCIHIWDWDNVDAIINLLKPRKTIYARKCKISIIDKKEAKKFIDSIHIQKNANADIYLGLTYNGELISIMSFGKPRYNKNYEWELVRYCSLVNVIGGAEKIWKYFINTYKPLSIISYCDMSKFNGNTYIKLGMTLLRSSKCTRHWYNLKTGQHITDNLLRQRGFDQLFGTNFGKGTDNTELMLNNGFVDVYDCGQNTYIIEFDSNEVK